MFTAMVIQGEQFARVLGFPTANLAIPPKILNLDDGVYAALTIIDNVFYNSALIISRDGEKVEVHVLDQDLDLYGKEIAVQYLSFICPIIPCSGKTTLKSVVIFAIEKVRSFFDSYHSN